MSTTTTTIDRAARRKRGCARFVHKLRHGDEIAHLLTLMFAAGILLLTSALVYELWLNSALSRQNSASCFLDSCLGSGLIFGAAPFIYGTLVTAVVSLVIAVPLGLAGAIFLAELAPRKTKRFHRLSD